MLRSVRRHLIAARGVVTATLSTATLAVGALTLAPAPLLAWDGPGHMTIALIAWRHMTPEARTIAARLLGAAPSDAGLASLRPTTGTAAERDRALFLLAATWPDIVRASTPAARHAYSHPSWHYVDQYWESVNGTPRPVTTIPVDSENVGERITAFTHELATASGPRSQRGVELAWMIHLVGDITQPLHNSSRVTPDHPTGDLGGNTVRLGPETHSLHALWDTALELGVPRNPGESTMTYVARLADTVEADRPLTALAGQVEPGRVDLWEREGLALSQHVVYAPSLTPGQDPDPAYRAVAYQTAETQVALAGYRLADLLDRILPRSR